ncbi:MAG: hypothetical protein P8Y67_15020 [Alphaproteobacteria bacterium]
MKKLFFNSLCLDEEIPPSIFDVDGGVIAYKRADGSVSHCELYSGAELTYVVYIGEWPAPSITAQHALKYPGCKFEIKNHLNEKEKNVITRHVCLANGECEFVIEEILNRAGDIVRENRFDRENNFIGALEYKYDSSGEIILTREIAANGDIISESEEM